MPNEKSSTVTAASEPLLEKSENSNGNEVPVKKSTCLPEKKENGMKKVKSVAIIEKKKYDKKKYKKVPPDGGWGWLVLFGATLVNVLVPGTVKSFGVLFVEFLEVFQATPSAGAWIPALCYFLYSSLGPVSSILSLRYSYRTVTLIGGTFAAAGMMITFFAQSVAHLYVTYGLFVGIGAGLSFPPTVYIVTGYFVKLRGLANGICMSGSALGSIFLPPILRIILETYGYRGAVLLMGAVTLNVWVAALFYDPVEKHMKLVSVSNSEDTNEEAEALKPKFIISTEDSTVSLHHLPHNESFADVDIASNNFNRSASSAAMQNLKSIQRERKISMPTGRTELLRAKHGSSTALRSVPERGGQLDSTDVMSQPRLRRVRSSVPRRSPSTSSFQYVSTPYHGSTLTLQPEIFASSFSLRGSTGKLSKAGAPQKKKFIDLTLLKDPLYVIILISNATNAISYTNFIILLPAFAMQVGFDKNAGAMLLSVVSAFDLVGRIGGSALSDLQFCPKLAYFIGGLVISGFALAAMPFYGNYVFIATCCGIFGLASGTYTGITAVVMADMLGEDRLQSTYGISLFVNGIVQLISPPICGLWFEAAKSYTSLFFSLGILLIFGSVIWGILPFIGNKSKEETVTESP